jgi:hypothetical protein
VLPTVVKGCDSLVLSLSLVLGAAVLLPSLTQLVFFYWDPVVIDHSVKKSVGVCVCVVLCACVYAPVNE